MPKISIIMPVYNVEKYLKNSIESILNQTFRDFELLLINDGSKDSSGSICDAYAEKDERVKVIHQKNAGAPVARNKGLDAAMGKYIGFVDSDDYIHPQMYEFMYNSAVEQDADIIACDFQNVTDYSVQPENTDDCACEFIDKVDMLDKMYIIGESVFAQVLWNKLYKKSVIGDIRLTPGYVLDDFDFVYKVYYRCEKIVHVKRSFYYYMYNPDSIMNTKTYNPKKLLALDVHYTILTEHKKHNYIKAYNRVTEYYLLNLYAAVISDFNHLTNDAYWTEFLKKHLRKSKKLKYVFKPIKLRCKIILALCNINYDFVRQAYTMYKKLKNRFRG